MKKDFSPEERLLRLIKGSKKKEAPKDKTAEEKTQVSAARPAKTSAAISISLPFKIKGLNTRLFNTVLIVVLAALILYFIYDLLSASYFKKGPDIFAEDSMESDFGRKEDSLDIQPYSHYSSVIKGRNVFKSQEVDAEAVFTGPGIEEISADLSLIGIIAGNRPQAIIEEKKSGKSYFVYKGGSVGQTKVVDILEDSVVMEYQGQNFELVL